MKNFIYLSLGIIIFNTQEISGLRSLFDGETNTEITRGAQSPSRDEIFATANNLSEPEQNAFSQLEELEQSKTSTLIKTVLDSLCDRVGDSLLSTGHIPSSLINEINTLYLQHYANKSM